MNEIRRIAFFYVACGAFVELLICLISYASVALAAVRRLPQALKWLVPLAISHTVAEAALLYDLFYRLLRFPTTVTSAEIAVGLGYFQGALALLTAVLILIYISQGRTSETRAA